MANFSQTPAGAKVHLTPFTAHVDEQKLQDFKQLLQLSPIGPRTFENSHTSAGRKFGVTHEWLVEAKEYWLHKFDWRKHEDHINSFPNFKATVQDDLGNDLDIHFLALFSQKKDAVPVAFFHGWPGSFLEFLQILDILKTRYTPDTLPYHVVVPSLPGYAFSSGPPLDVDFSVNNAVHALNNLMIGLGLENYYAQGGDLGSYVAQGLARSSQACKGIHINFSPMAPPPNAHELPVEDIEKQGLERAKWFQEVGFAYALEHGTRTATIGFALSASPLALLSWIGEKFLEWTDDDPSLDSILESVTLYWLTDTFPRCIYPYRGISNDPDAESPRIAKIGSGRSAGPYIEKPTGYSFFPKELMGIPKSWVGTTCNLVHAATHTSGGHFAAFEKPDVLLKNFEEYIETARRFYDKQ